MFNCTATCCRLHRFDHALADAAVCIGSVLGYQRGHGTHDAAASCCQYFSTRLPITDLGSNHPLIAEQACFDAFSLQSLE